MNISFSTEGKAAIVMTKEKAEMYMRKHFNDTSVDLLLLNVMAGKTMTVNAPNKPTIIIKMV